MSFGPLKEGEPAPHGSCGGENEARSSEQPDLAEVPGAGGALALQKEGLTAPGRDGAGGGWDEVGVFLGGRPRFAPKPVPLRH